MRRPSLGTLLLLSVGLVAPPVEAQLAAPPFTPGDVDGSGTLDITDPVRLLGYLFLGVPAELGCPDAADVDDSRQLDIGDPVYLLNYLFLGGPPPIDLGTPRCARHPEWRGLLASRGLEGRPVKGVYFFPGESAGNIALYTVHPSIPDDQHHLPVMGTPSTVESNTRTLAQFGRHWSMNCWCCGAAW
jgi:hypothetical protein